MEKFQFPQLEIDNSSRLRPVVNASTVLEVVQEKTGLTLAEIAKKLGFSPATLRKWKRTGRAERTSIKKLIRYFEKPDSEDVEKNYDMELWSAIKKIEELGFSVQLSPNGRVSH